MKGNPKLIETLNSLLADELTAINQYMVHSEMCANWGYGRLHEATEKRAIDEMKHAEKLIGRILFLEGRPVVSKLNQIIIGAERGVIVASGLMAGGALGGVLGAGLRLFPWYAEDRLKTPFYDNEPVSQTVSALLFAGLCAYLWFASVRREKAA